MPRTEVLTPAQEHGADGAEARALDDIVHRFASEFPDVGLEAIRSIVGEGFGRTADAKVQNFRLVLAERWARSCLRDRTGHAGPHTEVIDVTGVLASRPEDPPSTTVVPSRPLVSR